LFKNKDFKIRRLTHLGRGIGRNFGLGRRFGRFYPVKRTNIIQIVRILRNVIRKKASWEVCGR